MQFVSSATVPYFLPLDLNAYCLGLCLEDYCLGLDTYSGDPILGHDDPILHF